MYAVVALKSLKDVWNNVPPNWDGADPCGSHWDGIGCNANNRVVTIDLSYNKGMTGALPTAIGNLRQLSSLSLNSNNFVGEIPATIGNLSKLYWLDLADNKLSGPIPVSRGTTPGLDMLVTTKHFHFGNNQLSGEIPSQLFSSNLTLIHLLLENNQLTGRIPSSLALVQTLEIVRLDRNLLNGSVPVNLNSLTSVNELYLANNGLTGPLPNLTGMGLLHYVDLSNNSFDPTYVPAWFSSLSSLTSFTLKNNRINGTLNMGSSYSSQLQRIDLQNNFVDAFTERAGFNVSVILVGNPICDEGVTQSYCTIPPQSNTTYTTPTENCTPSPCSSEQVSSPTCQCSYPYSGMLYFRAPSFYNYGNATVFESLQNKMMSTFTSHQQPVDSVSVSNPTKNIDNYLLLSLQVFPSGEDHFNRTGISRIGFFLSNQTFKPPEGFGPFYFIANNYPYFEGIYAIRQKKRAETATKKSDPFALWDTNSNSGGVPQLRGAKNFSFDEIKKCTNNFSEMNEIGSGGYGTGYLDPEYYMTQELTEKSDVYSFGVLLFELLTSRAPIVKGKYVVREVKETMDKTKNLYNLESILDPIVASNMAPGSVEKFVDLALRCVQELGVNRPTMSEVVKEIENIMEMAGLNPHNESASTSGSYEGAKKELSHPYTNESLLSHSGAYSPSI
ncbi:leucine-rich repeat receptor-like protein kinase cannot respond to DMBQ-like 1 PjCADL1 [Phtheirospermum japonicum]|uniref:Leucine-rich repeat receptor-like protein kinase cannot respond to DMBQ-like 1 PjCADL1 n=1 Tax=Phtheirospermum japonicum TaxID=374723 RepID=A0A830CGK8_9LAMI|nr:leucine-rich repeat receptor-like protein kinase cannot respond to DMBQ-like 1 PjCADL1 [Phtheirospermum japonicum]